MLESLYKQHSTGVYRFALSILRSPQDAEDVTQETFLRAVKDGSPRFRPGKERAFLYTVAKTSATTSSGTGSVSPPPRRSPPPRTPMTRSTCNCSPACPRRTKTSSP